MVKPRHQAACGIGPILAVTVPTADLAASTAAYQSGLGYVEAERGTVTRAESRAWHAPAMVGRAWTLLRSSASGQGAIRLVETTRPDGYRPMRHLGWAALEIVVTDVDALARRITDSGFQLLRPPGLLSSSSRLRALQATGPSGEVLYLTQQVGPLPGFDIPRPAALADRVFIAVLAAGQLEPVRSFYEHRFGARRASDHQVAIRVLNEAFCLPETTPHRLSSIQLSGQSLIEIDQYPPQASQKPHAPGELPWGVGLVSVAATEEAIRATVSPTGHQEGLPPTVSGQPLPESGRVCTRGAAGEILELVLSR